MKKLPTDIKQKWVAALRSGKYKQGIGYLRSTSDEYCCLGVLCDMSNSDTWVKEGDYYKLPSGSDTVPKFGDIDATVYDVLGQMVYDEDYDDYDIMNHLTQMNDNKKLSFEQIATWIDTYL